MDWVVLIVSIGSIPLASHMAFERHRSSRRWAWIAALVGPLAPVALGGLGAARHPAAAT
jgi:hypothetical protein